MLVCNFVALASQKCTLLTAVFANNRFIWCFFNSNPIGLVWTSEQNWIPSTIEWFWDSWLEIWSKRGSYKEILEGPEVWVWGGCSYGEGWGHGQSWRYGWQIENEGAETSIGQIKFKMQALLMPLWLNSVESIFRAMVHFNSADILWRVA